MVADSPRTRAQRDLEERVTVEKHHDRDEETQGKREMRLRLVRFIEGVAPAKFLLMMYQPSLLFCIQHTKLACLLLSILNIHLVIDCQTGEIVTVFQFREDAFPTKAPGEMMVVRYKTHVISVDGTERGESIAHYSEKGDQHVVNYIYYIVFAAADVDPAD